MKELQLVLIRLICSNVLFLLSYVLSAQSIYTVSHDEILEQRQEAFKQINAFEDPYEDSLWYQGRTYEFKVRSKTGSPYFFNVQSISGSLTFNKKFHDDLILSYNIILDDLILWTKGPNGKMIQLVLNKHSVEGFTLKHHGLDYNFRLNSEMNFMHKELKEGYYEVIYDDKLKMFFKHYAELVYDATNVAYYSYKYKKQVYLIMDNKLYILKNRRDYLKVFQDEKKSLHNYMRQEKINFENSDKQALLDLCEYSKSFLD